jgi:tetratricopeptide (TPR) repeat protein
MLLVAVAAGCKTRQASSKPAELGGDDKPVFAAEADKIRFDNLFFEGMKNKTLGRYDDAVDKFEQCLKITPKVADVYFQLSKCYAKMGRPLELEMLEKALKLDDDNQWYLEAQGEAQKKVRKNIEAANTYKKLTDLFPHNTTYYDEAAEQFVLAGKPADAIALMDKMEERFGISEEIIRRKEELYLYLGRPQKAIEEVKKLSDAMPGNTAYMGMLAELYSITGQYDKAAALFKQILGAEPDNGKAHFGLAHIYRQQGDSANTIKELKLAFADDEVELKEKINVILSIAGLGDADTNYRKQVFELVEILVRTHPGDVQSHAVYADLLFGDKQYEKAVREYKEALALDDNNYRVWQQYLGCYEQLADYESLEVESDKALELFPDRVMFYYFNATAAYHLKNYKKAASVAQAGIDMGIRDNAVNLGLYTIAGDAYNKTGNHMASDAAFDEALAIDPSNAYVLNNYAYYLSVREELLEKAASMAKKALELSPESPAYLDTYGWILYKSGRYEDALTYIEKANKLRPADGEILEHLGDIYYRLGRKEEAVQLWKKAKESGSESVQLDKKINEGKLSE